MSLVARLEPFATKLGHRWPTMRLLATLAEEHSVKQIVETGSLREVGNWAGDGQSTIFFDIIADGLGCKVHSVDSDEATTKVAKSVTRNVNCITDDSVRFLSNFGEPIDLLYLDSLDADENNLDSARHHLMELCAARPWLHSGSIVAVDDTFTQGERVLGKGRFITEFMNRIGIERVMGGYQSIWIL